MKKLSLLILTFIIYACGGGETPTYVPIANTAPTVPVLSYPTNNLVCINNLVNFRWIASTDSQNDAIAYQLEIATDNAFTLNLNTSTNSLLNKELTLVKGKLYYWRVKAIDSKNASSIYSNVNTFYTEGVGVTNHLPFAPVIQAPLLNSTQSNSTINLSWTAADADQDTLTYDVIFGTTNPPTQNIAADLTTNTTSTNVNSPGKYYWYVVVKDGKGGTTIGQIWNFTKS